MVIDIVIIMLRPGAGTDEPFQRGGRRLCCFHVGLAIVAQTLSTIAVAVALWRHRFEDLALGWASETSACASLLSARDGWIHDATDEGAVGRSAAR